MIKAITFFSLLIPLCSYSQLTELVKTKALHYKPLEKVEEPDTKYRPSEGFLPVISAEYTWTYGISFGFGSNSVQERFASDSIWEDGWYHERYYSLNEDGSEETVEGLYREHEGKLFKKAFSGVQETLVFDITVLKGDTILLDIDDSPSELYVESTDTIVFADGVARKRVILRCVEFPFAYQERTWIEGLGDLSSGYPACIVDASKQLICYSEESGIIYQADWADKCWLTTNTNELDIEQLTVYPNPVRDILSVAAEKISFQTYYIKSITGQSIQAGELPASGVDVSVLPSGVYILELRQPSGNRSVSTFVKQ